MDESERNMWLGVSAEQIDREIRSWLLARKDPDYWGPLPELSPAQRDEWEQMMLVHLPLWADPGLWRRVCDASVRACSPASSSDCRSGRLFELSREQIEEAQEWLRTRSSPDELDRFCEMVPFDVPSWTPGAMVRVSDGQVTAEVPVAAYNYVGCAFPQ